MMQLLLLKNQSIANMLDSCLLRGMAYDFMSSLAVHFEDVASALGRILLQSGQI
jgi:hypothetical protein